MRSIRASLAYVALLAVLGLTACMSDGSMPPPSDAQIRDKMVLDPQQIMNDLAPKTQKTLDIGPKIDKNRMLSWMLSVDTS